MTLSRGVASAGWYSSGFLAVIEWDIVRPPSPIKSAPNEIVQTALLQRVEQFLNIG
jgi:hypothetical protein